MRARCLCCAGRAGAGRGAAGRALSAWCGPASRCAFPPITARIRRSAPNGGTSPAGCRRADGQAISASRSPSSAPARRSIARNPSRFAPRQVLFAHAALSDPAIGRLLHGERAARAGLRAGRGARPATPTSRSATGGCAALPDGRFGDARRRARTSRSTLAFTPDASRRCRRARAATAARGRGPSRRAIITRSRTSRVAGTRRARRHGRAR